MTVMSKVTFRLIKTYLYLMIVYKNGAFVFDVWVLGKMSEIFADRCGCNKIIE